MVFVLWGSSSSSLFVFCSSSHFTQWEVDNDVGPGKVKVGRAEEVQADCICIVYPWCVL